MTNPYRSPQQIEKEEELGLLDESPKLIDYFCATLTGGTIALTVPYLLFSDAWLASKVFMIGAACSASVLLFQIYSLGQFCNNNKFELLAKRTIGGIILSWILAFVYLVWHVNG